MQKIPAEVQETTSPLGGEVGAQRRVRGGKGFYAINQQSKNASPQSNRHGASILEPSSQSPNWGVQICAPISDRSLCDRFYLPAGNADRGIGWGSTRNIQRWQATNDVFECQGLFGSTVLE